MNNPGSILGEEMINKQDLLKKGTEKEKFETNDKDFLKNKSEGAISEIAKQAELNAAVEEGLTVGLKEESGFIKGNLKINKIRILTVARAQRNINNIVNKEVKVKVGPYDHSEEELKNAVIELEQELSDPFAKMVYKKMAEGNKQMLLEYLVDNSISQTESKIIDVVYLFEANNNVVCFSDNGYLMQLTNKELVRKDKDIKVDDEAALYNLILPDGRIMAQGLNYDTAKAEIKACSKVCQGQLKEEFFHNEEKASLNKENAEDKEIEEYFSKQKTKTVQQNHNLKIIPIAETVLEINSKIESGLKLMEDMLAEDEENGKQTDKEKNYLNRYKEPELTSNIEPEINLKEPELTSNIEPEINSTEINLKEQAEKPNLDSSVASYAESIGIKKEELLSNQEFIILSQEQQQFVLETLRRSSLVKAKAEARENYNQEKTDKEWWKLGFSFNQNFHKKRHNIEAVRNMAAQGLEGYGKTEFAWLIEVVKNGPEVKTNSQGQLEVNCLHDNQFSAEKQTLISQYNEEARKYIELPKGNTKEEGIFNFDYSKQEIEIIKLNEIKDEILKNASADELPQLLYNFIEAEKNIKLLRFLSANKETEKLINKLGANSVQGWNKTKMMIGGQKDKAGFSALGFSIRMGANLTLSTNVYLAAALSYSVAPVVAAIIGGFRAYKQNRKELDEQEEFAQIGFKNKSKIAKTMNLAVGKKEDKDGQEINIGLSDKLEWLISKLKDQKNNSASTEEIEKTKDLLYTRINYTKGRMSDGLVSYGPASERGINYSNLVSSIIKAQNELYMHSNLLTEFSNYQYVGKKVKETTRYGESVNLQKKENESLDDYQKRNEKYINWINDEAKLEELKKISVEDRLASFLGYQEDNRHSREVKFFAKKVAWGMILGASFAAAGSFVAGHLGISNWLSNHNPIKFVGHGANSLLDSAGNLVRSVFSQENAIAGSTSINSAAKIIEDVAVGKTVVAGNGNSEVLNSAEKVVPAKIENVINKITQYVDEISNQGLNGKSDSVWRSVREIFKTHSAELGYQGDLNDQTALNRWAETQTANVIHNSGDLSDNVSEGNQVKLEREGNHFRVIVEQGDGPKPGHLNHELNQKTNHSLDKKIEIKVDDSKEFDNSPSSGQDVIDKIVDTSSENSFGTAPSSEVNRVTPAVINEITKLFHVAPEAIKSVGDELVYQSSKGGKIIFDSSKGIIKEVFDGSNNKIPKEFIDELKGRTSLEKFARRGGLEKIFSNWNKLGTNDKTFYETFHLFTQGKLESSTFINTISNLFKVKTEGVYIDQATKHFILNGHRSFDITHDGVSKLVKVLNRKY